VSGILASDANLTGKGIAKVRGPKKRAFRDLRGAGNFVPHQMAHTIRSRTNEKKNEDHRE
jgi:hypothetical protein